MVKRKLETDVASDEEEGSVEGDSEAAEEDETPVKTKPSPRQQRKGKAVKEEDELRSDDAPLLKEPPKAKTVKKPKFSTSHQEEQDVVIRSSEEGDKYVDLGKRKRATVRTFKGSTFVDIREYYESGGAEKPGKKGISLSLEQWKCLRRSVEAIDTLFSQIAK